MQVLLVVATAIGLSTLTSTHAQAPKAEKTDIRHLQPRDYARALVLAKWGDPNEFGCLTKLWGKESAWNYKAKSPTHDYGIPQRHMSHNTPKEINKFLRHPQNQIQWGLTYIETRYKSPCRAWAKWQQQRWY